MRLNAEQIYQLFESLDYHVAVYDREWRYTYVNAEAAHILGRSPDELLGHSIWDLFPEAIGNQYYRELHEAAASGHIIHSDHYYAPWERWFENHIYPFADGVMVLARDVTRERRAAMALEEAKNAAESANRVKDQFLAALSHELRTPLHAIVGYSHLLKTNALPPEHWGQAVEVIHRNAVAQAQLVDDLLDLSRITAGNIRLEPAQVSVTTVLREAAEVVTPAAAAKRVRLEIDAGASADLVMADAMRLQQVFWNLLSNAIKFTADGGRVVASVRREGDAVEVAVADTGAGIAPDFVPHLFEPFRQGDEPARRGGLGLGLAISKQLVELHGGTIGASSAGRGHGATFTVRLPLVAADARGAVPPIPVKTRDHA